MVRDSTQQSDIDMHHQAADNDATRLSTTWCFASLLDYAARGIDDGLISYYDVTAIVRSYLAISSPDALNKRKLNKSRYLLDILAVSTVSGAVPMSSIPKLKGRKCNSCRSAADSKGWGKSMTKKQSR